jgi:hypothetical protein
MPIHRPPLARDILLSCGAVLHWRRHIPLEVPSLMLKIFQDIETAPVYAPFDGDLVRALQDQRPAEGRLEALLNVFGGSIKVGLASSWRGI